MEIKNIFDQSVVDEVISRIDKLTPNTERQWGKMTPSQMLAHCCVAYEMVYDNKHPKRGAIVRFLLNMLVKETVCGDKPYRRNSKTASAFLIVDERDFNIEKKRLIIYLRKTHELGPGYFDGRESNSFGPLNIKEWNTMFYKHLDHHLTQFGV